MDAHWLTLSSSSLSRRDHQSLRLVVFSLCLSFRDVEKTTSDARMVLKFGQVAEQSAENFASANRLRERVMRFKSAGRAQRFLSASESLAHTPEWVDICTERSGYRAVMKSRFAVWKDATCV